MLGEYLTALLVAVLGYIYPVYLCFKARRDRSSRVVAPERLFPLNRLMRRAERFEHSLTVETLPSTPPQALEKHKRKPEALRGWCIYWTVLGLYTVGVQIADRFVFWLPMYCEAKVAFVVYLWHPRTQGALYVYDAFVAPFLVKHEPDIDRRIDETRASVGDVVVRHSQNAMAFAREKFAAALTALPQAVPQGGDRGGGFAARNATEAAAMAYTRAKKH